MKKQNLIHKLSSFEKESVLPNIVVGFDGFTDEIASCVKTRKTITKYDAIGTIQELANRISEASQVGTNIEVVVRKKKIGGNAPILALALGTFGLPPYLIGAIGYPDIEPLFEPIIPLCKKVYSFTPSSHTLALEFQDGKILLGMHESILTVNPELIISRISKDIIQKLFNDCDIFASVNWTMILEMTRLWQYFRDNIFPLLSQKKREMFVDLADPAKRSEEDLKQAITTLQTLKPFFKVTLGLNALEAERVGALFQKKSHKDIGSFASFLQEKTEVDQIVIHTTKQAAFASKDVSIFVDGPFCSNPYLTTGGGDNFNAGILSGIALNLTPEEILLLGVATSGFYVRTGYSPKLSELISFIETWDTDPILLENLLPKRL